MKTRIAFLLGISLVLVACRMPEPSQSVELPPSPRALGEGAVVHLFEWRWDDVATECETFLAPAGYTAVQVSPPSENHVVGTRPWWERYQPVSYQLETRSGSRQEFASMVQRCGAVGVDIYVDAIINHMADADVEHDVMQFSGQGTNGSTFGPFEYPGLYGYDDFNHCGLTENDDIWDWDSREQAISCELVDLADLNTARPNVRRQIVTYLQDLIDLGVAGFRIDAARHIPEGDVKAIADSVRGDFYFYQEVSAASDSDLYTPMGAVTDFSYGGVVSDRIRTGRLADLNEAAWRDVPLVSRESAFVFIDNHDNQRGHGAGGGVLTHKSGPLYDMAVAFMLAQGYGRPRVMSSFAFEDDAQGPPADADEHTIPVHGTDGTGCGPDWVCEHRRDAIAGFAGFAAAVSAEPLQNWSAESRDRISFARGSRGFAAFNASESVWTADLSTGLPEGLYCNVGDGPLDAAGSCAGSVVAVDSEGRARISVDAGRVLGLHVEATTD